MRTRYDKINAQFSDLAHVCARFLVYPKIFGTNKLKFENTIVGSNEQNTILDGQLAIDRIVHVTSKDERLKAPLRFTVQERFRKMSWANKRDITITEWNKNSNLPSELYKIASGMFLYGYFDDVNLSFGEVVLVNTIELLFQLSRGEIDYEMRPNKKNQNFLAIPFSSIKPIFHMANSERINFDLSLPSPVLAQKLDITIREAILLAKG